jgi:TfoX/Sxy family transcriptional regulator of competence genes
MPKMTWKKSPESLVERFAAVLPDHPSIERRSMFGYPAAFLNGNMFCGLYQDHFILRLPEAERIEFLKLPGAKTFEPMRGRPMKEYVDVPAAVLANDSELQSWIRVSRAYVSGLPAKSKEAKGATKTAKKKSPTEAKRTKRG